MAATTPDTTPDEGAVGPPDSADDGVAAGLPHLIRTVERYVTRLGGQAAAAITYFSVLAVVPILMFAFAIAGIVLTVVRPELLTPAAGAIADAIGTADPATRQQILDLAGSALGNWKSVGIVGLVSAVYSGAGWMGNLKNAVRAQWRPAFEVAGPPGANIVLVTLKGYAVNLLQLVVLVVAMAVTFGLASLSTTFADRLLDLVGLTDIGWLNPVLRLVPVVFSVGAGFVLFLFLYRVLPETREPRSVVYRGAVIGAVGLAALQYLSTFLVGVFSTNRAFAVFGSVIALMLFLNLFAQLILFMAAWIATAHHPAAGQTATGPGPDLEREAVPNPEPVEKPVSPAHGRPGYLAGGLTGLGLGAALTWVVTRRR